MCPRLVEKLEAAGIWMTSPALGKEVKLVGFQKGLRVHGSQGVFGFLDICGEIAIEERGLLGGGGAVGGRPG
jgi:hypothetical protein